MLTLIPKPIARVYFARGYDERLGERAKRGGRENDDGGGGGGDEIEEEEEEAAEEAEEMKMMTEQLESLLAIFGDAYLNKHWVYAVLELVLLRLVPEMGERTTRELLVERGVGGAYEGEGEG